MSAMGDMWLYLRERGIRSQSMMQLYLDEISVARNHQPVNGLRAAGKVKELRRVIRLIKRETATAASRGFKEAM